MPKATLNQVAFNGGKLGRRVQGRIDLSRYRTGCNDLRNFRLSVQGPAVKRSGTRFVAPTKFDGQASRLISFEFSRDQSYVLEFGNLYMRVFRDSGAVLNTIENFTAQPLATNPVTCQQTGHPFSNGDHVFITGSAMVELNNRFFRVTNALANAYDLEGEDGTGRTTGTGGGAQSIYEIPTVYTAAQVSDIQTAQSADTLYIAHPDVAPHKVTRTSDTAWTAAEIGFEFIPFAEENITDTTVGANAETGTGITLTASTAIFTTETIGQKFKLAEVPAIEWPKWQPGTNPDSWVNGTFAPASAYETCYYEHNVYRIKTKTGTNTGNDAPIHEEGDAQDQKHEWTYINSGFGYGEITAIGGPSPSLNATLDVDTDGIRIPRSVDTTAAASETGSATKKWAFGAWSDENGYPRAVAFYEDRLWWAGTTHQPQTFWGSRTGDYENHHIIPDQADSAVVFTLASEKINEIESMVGEEALFLLTRGGEWTADSGAASEAITPSNIRVRRRSTYGSSTSVQPLSVDSAILFLQRSGERLHELIFDFDTDGYIAPDLTDMSYDILQGGVEQMAYQASPFREVWAAKTDGALASLTYIKDQEVLGWGLHVIGGTDTKAESIAVIPHPDGDEDQLWMIVSRTIDGGTVRYIEFMEKLYQSDDDQEDAFFVDSGLTYSGGSTSTITGLQHLEGESVMVNGNGDEQGPFTVTDGDITLTTAVTKAQVGLAMPEARLQTMRLEGGMEGFGAAQGRRKRVRQIVARVDLMGQGLKYGGDFTDQKTWNQPTGTPIPLYSGDTVSLDMPSGWEREGRVALAHDAPLPCTIVSIMPQLNTEPR